MRGRTSYVVSIGRCKTFPWNPCKFSQVLYRLKLGYILIFEPLTCTEMVFSLDQSFLPLELAELAVRFIFLDAHIFDFFYGRGWFEGRWVRHSIHISFVRKKGKWILDTSKQYAIHLYNAHCLFFFCLSQERIAFKETRFKYP